MQSVKATMSSKMSLQQMRKWWKLGFCKGLPLPQKWWLCAALGLIDFVAFWFFNNY